MLPKFNFALTFGVTFTSLCTVWASGALSMPNVAYGLKDDVQVCVSPSNMQSRALVVISMKSLSYEIDHVVNKTTHTVTKGSGGGVRRTLRR